MAATPAPKPGSRLSWPPRSSAPAGAQPVCVVDPDGSCDIEEPSYDSICPPGVANCQWDAVDDYYNQVGARCA